MIVQWLIMLNTAVGWFITHIYIYIEHADGYWHSVYITGVATQKNTRWGPPYNYFDISIYINLPAPPAMGAHRPTGHGHRIRTEHGELGNLTGCVEESIDIFGHFPANHLRKFPNGMWWVKYGFSDHPPGDSRGFEDIHDIRGILHNLHIAILHLQTIPHHLKISRDQSDQHQICQFRVGFRLMNSAWRRSILDTLHKRTQHVSCLFLHTHMLHV